jgi:hypothetical protein
MRRAHDRLDARDLGLFKTSDDAQAARADVCSLPLVRHDTSLMAEPAPGAAHMHRQSLVKPGRCCQCRRTLVLVDRSTDSQRGKAQSQGGFFFGTPAYLNAAGA